MKKIAFFFAFLFLIPSMLSCSSSPDPARERISSEPVSEEENGTAQFTETKTAETLLTETVSEEQKPSPPVLDPLTPEKLDAIPIANDGMSTDQLRQICVDFFSLQVSFSWVPNENVTYLVDGHGVNVSYETDSLYGGIPYVNVGSGNLYRIIRCYDSQTGVLDVSALSDSKELFGNACSGSASWSWSRVVNSATLSYTANMTMKNGCIPVGPYTYDHNTFRFGEDGFDDCDVIAVKNGKSTMLESYALIKKADGLVNRGHVIMCSSEPVVIRNEDGAVDGAKSYLTYCEQGLYTTAANRLRVQKDGTEYRVQGGVDVKITFDELFNSYYLPFTFAEFLGTDPVEEGEIYAANGTDAVLDPQGLTLTDLDSAFFYGNYSISDAFTTVTDAEGNLLLDYTKSTTGHYARKWNAKKALPFTALREYAKQEGCRMTIRFQLGNGQIVTFYDGPLHP